ncbi:unnamed protein product [Trichogramma brassicae]|uniref:Helicase POLQ-like n=1 Tax=Trichogramma brassicae TaxID=86971 RepID=A0A6H5I9B5_9HYME|nr:unnamed protein product [Trichogramma brassicae]
MSDLMNISTWNFDDVVVPLTPEYMMKTHTDSASLEGSKFISSQDSDPLQELLSLDDTIFDHIEVDANVDSNAHGKSQLFNESKFFLDETLHDDPSNCSDNAADCLLEDSFIKYNNNVADELNVSVNFLKAKLFDMPGEKFVQPPKKKTCFEKSNNATNLKKSNDFYGLPEILKNSIKKYKGIDKLYDWQDECLKMKAIEERKNLIYALPTSGGKTLVAEILMFKEIICNKKNVMFVLPFVALVQEKIQAITPFALEFNFLIEEYAAAKGTYPPKKRRKKNSLYICTIEKAQTIINCLIELNRLEEIGMIVVDELHLLGESGGRGATLECLLTKVLHSNSNIHIIGMSATIGNLEEITSFLKAELYIKNFRPVDIKEYVKCETDIWLVDSRLEEIYTDKKTINYPYSERARQLDPDFLGGLVMDVVPKDSCLIFCASRKNCENVAVLLTQVLFSSLEKHRSEEKLKLLSALQTENNEICPILSRTIKYGVAYHHSGLTGEERKLIEEAFKSGVLCVICCTSTLAAGVNLPARRVILRSPYIGSQFLNLSRYKQMIGRAGRAGLGEIGESILICSQKDMMLNVDNRIVARFYVTLMLYELWNRKSIYHVAQKYQVNRGTIQNLLNLAASFATSTVRFCQELDEFWAYSDLLTTFGQKLTYCCASELEPLMDLPYVKIGRAKQLYKAGYKTLQSIAKAKPKDLMNDIDNLSKKVVSQIISAAKLILMEKVENLRDEVEEVLDGLEM